MEIPKKIKDDIWEYCRLNNITGVDEFIQRMIKQGFTVEKFGAVPNERIIEKEVEKIVEVPVEKIVEIEVIKEVPVEKIVEVEVIKEVPVEVIKEVQVTDDIEMQKLFDEIDQLKYFIEQDGYRMSSIQDKYQSSKDNVKGLGNQIVELKKKLEIEKSKCEKFEGELIHSNTTIGVCGLKINTLEEKIKELEGELETEKNKPKVEDKKDIYGEDKRGTFGSNTSDIWKKK